MTLLELRDLASPTRPRAAACRRSAASNLTPRGRPDARPGRRVRLRQVDDRRRGAAAAAARRRRSAAQVLLDGEDVLTMSWGQLRAVRWAGASIVFQGAMHSLNPVQPHRRARSPSRSCCTSRTPAQAAAGQRVAELLEQVGLPAAARPTLPARAVRRPEAARHDRDGAGLLAAPDHRRRADHGARRDDPGPGAGPDRGPGRRPRHRHDHDQPRPVGAGRHLRPAGGDVRRARSSRRARPTRSSPTRRHPYTRGAGRGVPDHRRPGVEAAPARPARRPAGPGRPAVRAAPSTRGARSRTSSARSRRWSCGRPGRPPGRLRARAHRRWRRPAPSAGRGVRRKQ